MAEAILDALRHEALWFEEGVAGIHPLIDAIGDASLVLIGRSLARHA